MLSRIDLLVAPLALLVCFYVATLMVLGWMRFPFPQWTGLIAIVVSTGMTVAIWEKGRWSLGFFVPLRDAVPEFLFGTLFGVALIAACALLVVLLADVRHARGSGFPWLELVSTFVPAAVHEELLFRGYGFQKLYRWRRWFAIILVALIFAGLHAGNESVTALGLVNIFLGGVLLGLAYALYERLWFPIGLHLAWNLMTGPILGHEVSGYEALRTLFVEVGDGAEWLTGGEFGLEGSAIMTFIELMGIALLMRRKAEGRMKKAE